MTKEVAAPEPEETITSYKGFDKDWKCRGFQFALGETFVHDGNVEACASGFHAFEYPLDVFKYYAPAGNRFAVVQQVGQLSRHSDDTKVASKTLTVSAEINLAGLIKAAIAYTKSKCGPIDPESPSSATGDGGASSATGDGGASSATGYGGASSATGLHSVAMATGFYGKAMAGETAAIVLVNRNDDGSIRHIRASKAGENGVVAGVWYTLDANGEFAEAA